MKHVELKGIIPPIVPPMNDDEEQSVNLEVLRQQTERLLAGGVHGLFPCGTNGEAFILSTKEKEAVIETVIDQVAGRVPVYAGTGCISTADTIYMSKRAEQLGADVLRIITPSFAVASQKELYDHYVAVAKHVNIPIVLYNIPARTGNKLLPETVQALCRDVDVIVGAKDSSGDLENLKAYIRLTQELPKKVAVLAGNDGNILNCLKADYTKIFASPIITDLMKVLGCGVEVQGKKAKELSSFDLSSLRWSKIVICTDADVDGFQIRTLILTMLYRLCPTLIRDGYVFIAESPLFEITCKDKTWFAYNEQEKVQILKELEGKKVTIQRSKGLGENDPEMMWMTTMNPETRRLIKVMPEDAERTAYYFNILLGDSLTERKNFIAENGARYLELADIS